jgi:hypothetical protein
MLLFNWIRNHFLFHLQYQFENAISSFAAAVAVAEKSLHVFS